MDIVTYALLNGKIKDNASNVDKWLEENVDPATGYVLDRSLQMENAAAPADMVGDINDEVGNLKNTLSHKADVIYDTASGDIASFPDGADGLPVKDLTVGIEPVQDLHGYENTWPAGGGNNKLPNSLQETKTIPGEVTITSDGKGNYTCSATTSSETTVLFDLVKPYTIPVSAGSGGAGCFRINNSIQNSSILVTLYYDNTQVDAWSFSEANRITYTYSGMAGNTINRIGVQIQAGVNANFTFSPMFTEDGSTSAVPFAPYSNICPISGWDSVNIMRSGADTSDPTTYTIQLGQTIYGGTLDVTAGTLTVDRKNLDLSTLTFEAISNNRWASDIISGILPITNVKVAGLQSDTFKVYSADALYNNNAIGCAQNVQNRFIVRNGSTTVAPTGNIVCPLATPLVIQLDPVTVTVQTLLGQNNIWADCGPSTVEYPADTKLYIQKINTPTDDDMIADAQIASGKYFIVGNNLYLSTTTILAGDPIKPGTNCTLTNLAAALNALNS